MIIKKKKKYWLVKKKKGGKKNAGCSEKIFWNICFRKKKRTYQTKKNGDIPNSPSTIKTPPV